VGAVTPGAFGKFFRGPLPLARIVDILDE